MINFNIRICILSVKPRIFQEIKFKRSILRILEGVLKTPPFEGATRPKPWTGLDFKARKENDFKRQIFDATSLTVSLEFEFFNGGC